MHVVDCAITCRMYCPRRLSSLASLSIDMHPAAKCSSGDDSGGDGEPGALHVWRGGFPTAICSLPCLTELDFSMRAFASPSLALPEVSLRRSECPPTPFLRLLTPCRAPERLATAAYHARPKP
jgi:hypothetical protein